MCTYLRNTNIKKSNKDITVYKFMVYHHLSHTLHSPYINAQYENKQFTSTLGEIVKEDNEKCIFQGIHAYKNLDEAIQQAHIFKNYKELEHDESYGLLTDKWLVIFKAKIPHGTRYYDGFSSHGWNKDANKSILTVPSTVSEKIILEKIVYPEGITMKKIMQMKAEYNKNMEEALKKKN